MATTASVTATGRRSSTKPRARRPRRAPWSSSISTSAELARHFAYLEEALAESERAVLSRKKAMLVAHLIDALVDRLFSAEAEPAGDILKFRDALRARSEAVGLVFDLVAERLELMTEAVQVPIAEYSKLGVEDFMVSLYNDHTVQRLRFAGRFEDVHEVLAQAVEALRGH